MSKMNGFAAFTMQMKPTLIRLHGPMSFQQAIQFASPYWQALPPEAQNEWKNRARTEELSSHNTKTIKKKPNKSKPATHLNEEEYKKLQRLCMGDDSELDEYADEEVNVLVKEQIDYVNSYKDDAAFKRKRMNDDETAYRTHVLPTFGIEGNLNSCLPAFNENWAVLHMTPMKMRGITPGLAVYPAEIALVICSAKDGLVIERCWQLDWAEIDPETVEFFCSNYSSVDSEYLHCIPPAFERTTVKAFTSISSDVIGILDEIDSLTQYCGGKRRDIIIDGNYENYNNIASSLRNLRRIYFADQDLNDKTIQELLVHQCRLRCLSSLYKALGKVPNSLNPKGRAAPEISEAWKQHSLATLIENCKDDEAMSTGGCLYHDIKGLKPRRGDGCALRSAKILAYHLIEQFAGWPELDGKIDNDKNKATFFGRIGSKLIEPQSMAIGGNIVNDVLTLNIGDTLIVKEWTTAGNAMSTSDNGMINSNHKGRVVGDDYHECSRVVIENEQQQEEVKAMDATSLRRQQRIPASLLARYKQ